MFSQLLGSHGAAILVYLLLFSSFSFLVTLLFLVVTAEFSLVEMFIRFFDGFNCCSSSEYASTIVTLRGHALVNGHLDWDIF